MKTIKTTLRITVVFTLFLFSNISFAQLNWKKGGNNSTPAGNTLGTDATNNTALAIITNGTTRMFMQNNTAPTAGFIGIGNGFLTPQSRLHQHEPGATFNYHQFVVSSGLST